MRALAVCAADPDEGDTDYSEGEGQRQREAQLLAEDDRDDRSCGSLAGEDRSHNGDRTGLKRGESGEVGRHGHRRGRDRETNATRGQMRRTGCHHDRQDGEGPDREGQHQHWGSPTRRTATASGTSGMPPQNGREEAEDDRHGQEGSGEGTFNDDAEAGPGARMLRSSRTARHQASPSSDPGGRLARRTHRRPRMCGRGKALPGGRTIALVRSTPGGRSVSRQLDHVGRHDAATASPNSDRQVLEPCRTSPSTCERSESPSRGTRRGR